MGVVQSMFLLHVPQSFRCCTGQKFLCLNAKSRTVSPGAKFDFGFRSQNCHALACFKKVTFSASRVENLSNLRVVFANSSPSLKLRKNATKQHVHTAVLL
jgi:hypothetical protein